MKKVFFISLLFLSSFSKAQNKELNVFALGWIYTMPENYQIYPLTLIDVRNMADRSMEFKMNVILYTKKEIQATVLAIKMNDNLCYVAAYAPVIENNLYTDKGEFYLYKKENGTVEMVTHVFKNMTTESNKNKLYYHLEEGEFTVSAEDRMMVAFMIFKGYGYVFPDYYFK